MAEGFMRHIAGGSCEVFSAGVNPTRINPLAIKAMAEVGVDISRQQSTSVREYLGDRFDYVITVCDNARQNCPVFPGKHERIHWDLRDPAEATGDKEGQMTVFRKVRDQIKDHIREFAGIVSAKSGKELKR